MIYSLLTGCIILLGKLRERFNKQPHVRFDRTIPCPPDQEPYLYISCCDCGLVHFFVPWHSGTPLRPINYKYRLRFGAKPWTEPDINLGQEGVEHAIKFGLVKKDELIYKEAP